VCDLEDEDEDEKEKHVDNVEDDRLLNSNAEEQSRTDKQPVLDQQIPQPPTYRHRQTDRDTQTDTQTYRQT